MIHDKPIRYLSLAAKAGQIVIGMQDIRQEVSRKKGYLIVLALDAGENTRRKARSLASAGGVPLKETRYSKSEISDAIGCGRDVAVILIRNEGLAGAFVTAHAMEWEERI